MYNHIEAYSHNGKIGVLVELQTIDDWTSKTDEFICLAKDLALQIAATDPVGIESIDKGKVIHLWPGLNEGVNGELLLTQKFIKEPAITVKERIFQTENKLKAKINVVRFIRYQNNET